MQSFFEYFEYCQSLRSYATGFARWPIDSLLSLQTSSYCERSLFCGFNPHAVLCTRRPAPEAPKGVQNFAGLILFACIFLYGFEILMRDLSLEIKTLIERIFL